MTVKTYILAPGSTWKGSAFSDSGTFTVNETSTPTEVTTDGSRYVNNIVVDRIKCDIQVTVTDNSLLSGASFRAGSSGALVLKGKLRGAGNTVSTDLTLTFGEAVLISSNGTLPGEGQSQVVIQFSAYDSTSDGSQVVYS